MTDKSMLLMCFTAVLIYEASGSIDPKSNKNTKAYYFLLSFDEKTLRSKRILFSVSVQFTELEKAETTLFSIMFQSTSSKSNIFL